MICFDICIKMYILYNVYMKTITTTEARKNIKTLLDSVAHRGESFIIERHNRPEVLVIPFRNTYNPEIDEITNFNAMFGAFDWLKDEPDLYSTDDIKKKYV